MRVLALTVLLAATAQAETATEALKARDAEIRAALPKQGTEPTPATRKKLETIVTQAVDLEGMAKQALGKTPRPRSERSSSTPSSDGSGRPPASSSISTARRRSSTTPRRRTGTK